MGREVRGGRGFVNREDVKGMTPGGGAAHRPPPRAMWGRDQ